jgi:hypothetical protein
MTNYDITPLLQLCEPFARRRFGIFLASWNTWTTNLRDSIYTIQSASQLTQAIERNVIAQVALPFAHMKLLTISSETGLPMETVRRALKVGIRSGKIHGKIDEIDSSFVGLTRVPDTKEMEEYLDRVVIIRERLEALKWAEPFSRQLKACKRV